MKEKREKRGGRWILWVLLVLLLIVFGVSAYMVIPQLISEKKQADLFQSLSDRVEDAWEADEAQQAAPEQGGSLGERPASPLFGIYAELKAENDDFYGWLRIPGTQIDYPVMYTPDDPQYYLHRDFNRASATAGTLFMDGYCTPEGMLRILYGHHMKNGSMFGKLADYADESFWQEHKTLRFDTLESLGTYEVVGAFYSQIYDEGQTGVFRYYAYTELPDEATYNAYVDQVKAASLYDTGVEPVFGDRLIVLSTCEYHVQDGRFVVVARLVNEREAPAAAPGAGLA